MSMRYLGRTFDIHTGGIDNMFPHHENEIAQSEAANGCRFVNYWLHCAHLMVDGEKMAKSAGNFYTLRDLIGRGGNGREIRWVLLGTHYRQPLNFSFQACRDAKAALQRLDDFVVRLREAQARSGPSDAAVAGLIADAESGFRAGLDDDLNISEALGALFNFVRDANRLLDAGGLVGEGATAALAALARIDRVLGVIEPGRQDDVPPGVAARARERQEARKARDFKRADAIREALRLDGWLIEDTPGGQRLKRL